MSAFRVVCVPVLLALAWNGATGAFLALFGLGLVSDVLDGALARRLGQESDFGARLDQWADFALWVSFPLGAWWLWPEIVRREAPYVILAIVCLLLPTAIAYAKYRAVPGYHTWSAKLDSVLMGIGVPLLLIFDLAWPFRLAALFLLVCAVDEILITYLLPECRHQMPSVFHAARLSREPLGDTTVISPARHARVAALAALIASVGDLLLLYVANAQRSELGLPEAGRAWLWLGGTLGVVAIPFYALGYRSASRLVAAVSLRAAQALFVAGAAGALLGSLIHGLTAVHLSAQLDAATPARDPLVSLVSWGPLLLTLWGLAALLVVVASALFLWFVGRGTTAAPRGAALSNPALLTIALAAAGLPSVLLRSFLTPAAPNIAHIIFFAVCSQVLRKSGPREGERAA